MQRFLFAMVVGLVLAATLDAHFIFVVPDARGAKAQVVFSDDLDPDENVPIEKVGPLKLFLREPSGKDTPLTWTKGKNCLIVEVPGAGPRLVHGRTDYGVMAKKDSKPYLLRYHQRAVLGAWQGGKMDDAAQLEIVPMGQPGKLQFLVAAKGKPIAGTEVTVLTPTAGSKKVKTDEAGLTAAFDAPGRYGAWARHFEATSGQHDGKSYEEIRHYATLVIDFAGSALK